MNPSAYRKVVTDTANHALAKSTWDSYKSSLKRLKDSERETSTPMNLPLEEREVLFIAFLIEEDLAASTIESYLSGLTKYFIKYFIYKGNLWFLYAYYQCCGSEFISRLWKKQDPNSYSASVKFTI